MERGGWGGRSTSKLFEVFECCIGQDTDSVTSQNLPCPPHPPPPQKNPQTTRQVFLWHSSFCQLIDGTVDLQPSRVHAASKISILASGIAFLKVYNGALVISCTLPTAGWTCPGCCTHHFTSHTIGRNLLSPVAIPGFTGRQELESYYRKHPVEYLCIYSHRRQGEGILKGHWQSVSTTGIQVNILERSSLECLTSFLWS